MQERHQDRFRYFNELAATSREYFIPYINSHFPIMAGTQVLEIGCGEGGNLLPFARKGCRVTGVDIAKTRINQAEEFFREAKAEGKFIASDIFLLKDLEGVFDVIICHDVFEHIAAKQKLLEQLHHYLKPGGVIFFSFPAWQMPFGGHQQICRNHLTSHLPFIHLLPTYFYRKLLQASGEDSSCIAELMSIKETGVTIEQFEHLTQITNWEIENRLLYFINPHYQVKFRLTPRKLWQPLTHLPILRNFLCTSCFYLLRDKSCSSR